MIKFSISDIIISVIFFIFICLLMRWLSNIDRKIRKEKFIKKYYSEILKEEEEKANKNQSNQNI